MKRKSGLGAIGEIRLGFWGEDMNNGGRDFQVDFFEIFEH